MSEHILNTVDPSAEQPSQHQAGVAVSLWFDLQPESSLKHKVPVWARTLAQAHVDQRVWVFAHPESAYAQSGLMCEVVEGTLWPDESWLDILKNAIQRAHIQGMSQIVLMLPNRASPIAWTQWALREFLALGGYLDNTTGLLQGLPGWQHILQREDALRWLVIDRFITYGEGFSAMDYVAPMRSFNPLAHWIHDDFMSDALILQDLNAHAVTASMSLMIPKSVDLDAWSADKVVYFSISGEMDRAKVMHLVNRWRENDVSAMVRIWANIRIKDQPKSLKINGICHLWRLDWIQEACAKSQNESHIWLLGKDIQGDMLKSDFEQCVTH